MYYQIFLNQALQEASQIANDSFGKVNGTIKGTDHNQILTETDLAVGKLLISQVKSAYPDYNIIDEEAGVIDNGSEFTWVIDPIDGTSNFAAGIPTYGIMLGLLKDSTPIAGGIVLPAFNQLLIAEKGQGAYCNEEKIAVSSETKLLNSLLSYGIDGHGLQVLFLFQALLIADVLTVKDCYTSFPHSDQIFYQSCGQNPRSQSLQLVFPIFVKNLLSVQRLSYQLDNPTYLPNQTLSVYLDLSPEVSCPGESNLLAHFFPHLDLKE